jgi:kynureninase
MNPYFREKAQKFDQNDVLSGFKNRFVETPDVIYLDGNSLGKMPKEVLPLMQEVIENQWGNRMIRSWNEHWIELPNKVSSKIAKLIGAAPDEVLVGDSTSVNLYKLAFAALRLQKSKNQIVTDVFNFPTDLYIFQGLIANQFSEHRLTVVDSQDDMGISLDDLAKIINNQTAVLSLSHVLYKSAFMYDMKAINNLAHDHNALTIWDLSHSAGAVPINLHDANADMAVGCTYKYLNGGPGAPAFLYVRKDLQEQLQNPITGWFGHARPFDFSPEYVASSGIERFATGTPSVLSLAATQIGLDIMLEAGTDNLRAKSKQQSEFLIEMIRQELEPLGFVLASPTDVNQRGSHVSIQHPEAYRINRAMINPSKGGKSIIPDFRPPNNIRLGIAPLYNTFIELHECTNRIKEIVLEKEYLNFGEDKLTVT